MAEANALVQAVMEKGFTEKQAQALRCALDADGRFSVAAKNCRKYGVSEGYLRRLFYSESETDLKWQLELQRRLGSDKPPADELDRDYVIRGLMALTAHGTQDNARLGALNSLAKILGLFTPQPIVLVTSEDLKELKALGIGKKELMAEVSRILEESWSGD